MVSIILKRNRGFLPSRMSYDFILNVFQSSLFEYTSYKNYFVDILITNLISCDSHITCFSLVCLIQQMSLPEFHRSINITLMIIHAV